MKVVVGGGATTVCRVVEKLTVPVLRIGLLCCLTMQLNIDTKAINKTTPPMVPPTMAPILTDAKGDDPVGPKQIDNVISNSYNTDSQAW